MATICLMNRIPVICQYRKTAWKIIAGAAAFQSSTSALLHLGLIRQVRRWRIFECFNQFLQQLKRDGIKVSWLVISLPYCSLVSIGYLEIYCTEWNISKSKTNNLSPKSYQIITAWKEFFSAAEAHHNTDIETWELRLGWSNLKENRH